MFFNKNLSNVTDIVLKQNEILKENNKNNSEILNIIQKENEVIVSNYDEVLEKTLKIQKLNEEQISEVANLANGNSNTLNSIVSTIRDLSEKSEIFDNDIQDLYRITEGINSLLRETINDFSNSENSNQNLISNISSQGNPVDIELITTQINNQSSNNILDNIKKKQSEQEELRNEIEASITNVISESQQINTDIQNTNENVLEINQELQEVNDHILNLGQSNSSSYSGLLLYGSIGIVSIFLYEYYIRNRIFRNDTVNVTNPNLDTGKFIGFGIYRNGGNNLPSDQPTTISDRIINFLFDFTYLIFLLYYITSHYI